MKPDLRILRNGDGYNLDGSPENPCKCRRIGYMNVKNSPSARKGIPEIFQIGITYLDGWCCSQWEQHPPERLWQMFGGVTALVTFVMTCNLKFVNTPFEYRHNLKDDPELAEKERRLWVGVVRKTFIPFKTPHPGGYQGVWMSPSLEMNVIGLEFPAHDKFNSGHALEFGRI